MGLKGELNTICLADIFQNLTLNNKEGTLTIEDGQTRKTIFFKAQGIFIYSEGTERVDLLGNQLVFREILTREELQYYLEEVHRNSCFLEEVLLQAQKITKETMNEILLSCSREEIYDLFIWKGAKFDFEESLIEFNDFDYRSYRKLVFGSEGVNSILLEAVRRVDEWEAIFKLIPSFEEILVPARLGIEELLTKNLSTQEVSTLFRTKQPIKEKVTALLNGQNTVQEVIRKAFLPRFEVCFAIAHMLRSGEVRSIYTQEMIYVADQLLSSGQAERAIFFYLRASQQGGDPTLMNKLAFAYEQIGQKERATELYMNYGLFGLQNHQIEEALESFKRVVALDKNQIEALEHIYNIYLANPNFPAVQGFDFVTEGLSLSEMLRKRGQVEKSNAYLGMVVDQKPEDSTLRQKLIDAYLSSGQEENAIQQYITLSKSYQKEGQTAELVDIYEKILKINRARSDIQSKLDTIYQKQREKRRQFRKKCVKFLLGIFLCGLLIFEGFREWVAYRSFQEQKQKIVESQSKKFLEEAQEAVKEYGETRNVERLSRQFPGFQEMYSLLQEQKTEQFQKIAEQHPWTLVAFILIPRSSQKEENQEDPYFQILTDISSKLNAAFSQKLQEARQKEDKILEEFQIILAEIEAFYSRIQSSTLFSEKNRKEFQELQQRLQKRLQDQKKKEELLIQKNEEAQKMTQQVEQLLETGEQEKAFQFMKSFLGQKEYQETLAYQKALIPFQVLVNLPAQIYVDGKPYVQYDYQEDYRFEVKSEGFEVQEKRFSFLLLPPEWKLELKKVPLWRSQEKLGEVRGKPLILEKGVLVGSSNKSRLYLLGLEDGREEWSWPNTALGDFDYGGVLDTETQSLYLADRKGTLLGFSTEDPQKFNKFWTYSFEKIRHLSQPLIISQARIPYKKSKESYYKGLCATVDDRLVAFARLDSDLKPAFSLKFPQTLGSPVLEPLKEEMVFFASREGIFYQCQLTEKKVISTLKVTVPQNKCGPLTLDPKRELLFSGADNGQFYALSYQKGLQRYWSTPITLPGSVQGECGISEDAVFVATTAGYLFCIDKNSGEIKWQWPRTQEKAMGGFDTGVCLDEEGNLYVGSRDFHLYALDVGGFLKWSYKTGGEILTTPVLFHQTLYFSSKDQYFYAIHR
jgi:hypothetical protein